MFLSNLIVNGIAACLVISPSYLPQIFLSIAYSRDIPHILKGQSLRHGESEHLSNSYYMNQT